MGLLSMYLYIAAQSTWLWIALLAVSLYWWYMRSRVGFYDTNILRTDEKTFVITGAESGIGKECCHLLAARGGRIIMACKDTTLGHATRDQIAKRTHNEQLEVYHLDLGSLTSVRKFSKDLHRSVDQMDALVLCTPPVCVSGVTSTEDGLNTIMQVNHFGPFLLTNLLLDLIKKSSPSRVVFVTSVFHHFHKFSLDNLNCEKESLPNCRIYFNSRLANILTTKYFARILKGTGVTVNSVHPGMAKPDPTSNASSCSGSIIATVFNLWVNIFGRSIGEAAMTPAYAATEPKLKNTTGKHFADCRVSSCVASIANDETLQDKLFEKSAQLVKLRPEEKHI